MDNAKLVDVNDLRERIRKAWNAGCISQIEDVESVLDEQPGIDPEMMRPVEKWISVKDRLPDADEGDDFLAVSKNGNFVFEAYFERDCGRDKNLWHDGCGHFYEITHWMPLPEPPEEDDNA